MTELVTEIARNRRMLSAARDTTVRNVYLWRFTLGRAATAQVGWV